LRVTEPLWGANNTPNNAPVAAPANTPNNTFPVLMISVLMIVINAIV
jgi:hypothetical protein